MIGATNNAALHFISAIITIKNNDPNHFKRTKEIRFESDKKNKKIEAHKRIGPVEFLLPYA